MNRRRPYYPGAEVWQHPRAEQVFAAINHMRTTAYKAPPLERDKVSTEDLVRERLRDGDKERRQMNRWRERSE
jgi:hypothetical protein